jgi:hypothetical protein
MSGCLVNNLLSLDKCGHGRQGLNFYYQLHCILSIQNQFCAAMVGNDIFQGAITAFISTLSPDHKQLFSSCQRPEDLLEQISQLDGIKVASQRQRSYLDSVKTFITRLQPYFNAIDVLVQCDPIHAASVWGALRVVIQVCKTAFLLRIS